MIRHVCNDPDCLGGERCYGNEPRKMVDPPSCQAEATALFVRQVDEINAAALAGAYTAEHAMKCVAEALRKLHHKS